MTEQEALVLSALLAKLRTAGDEAGEGDKGTSANATGSSGISHNKDARTLVGLKGSAKLEHYKLSKLTGNDTSIPVMAQIGIYQGQRIMSLKLHPQVFGPKPFDFVRQNPHSDWVSDPSPRAPAGAQDAHNVVVYTIRDPAQKGRRADVGSAHISENVDSKGRRRITVIGHIVCNNDCAESVAKGDAAKIVKWFHEEIDTQAKPQKSIRFGVVPKEE